MSKLKKNGLSYDDPTASSKKIPLEPLKMPELREFNTPDTSDKDSDDLSDDVLSEFKELTEKD